MRREAATLKIRDLRSEFARIEFPEYQREPTVWSREQKQRLIDSILREFDIAAIYLYYRDDGGWECIDGRQRLNAVMSFLGINPQDEEDDGFSLRIENEVVEHREDELRALEGLTFDRLPPERQEAILDYEVITVFLSASREPAEFNLQFLRLNLGALINAGEKLHAMVGEMRNLLFESERLGLHPFLARAAIPTRRYAREQTAAQIMLQASAKAESGEFTRARHFDLQRYLKQYSDHLDQHSTAVSETLDSLEANAAELGEEIGNRAICVSIVLAAWDLDVRGDPAKTREFATYMTLFLERLAEQVERMKAFDLDPRYEYLVTFQRQLTQAAVEKPAVTYRHRILVEQFAKWRETGELRGDSEPAAD